MVRTRPSRGSAAGDSNENVANPPQTRKRRASNISSQRNPAPRSKRIRSDTDQLNAEDEAATQRDEGHQDSDHVQDEHDQNIRLPSTEPLPSSPPVRTQQSTTLTQRVEETTIHTSPLASRPTKPGRGRQSMPARLRGLSSDVEVRQFAPFSEVLDSRSVRRNRRSHLSEEQNTYRQRHKDLLKKVDESDARIRELEFDREADRQMGTARILDDEKDEKIAILSRERAQLVQELADIEKRLHSEEAGEHAERDDDDMVIDYPDLNTRVQDAEADPADIEAQNIVVLDSQASAIPSYALTQAKYQSLLQAKERQIGDLKAAAGGILLQLQSLQFDSIDGLVPSMVAKIHESFAGARFDLRQLNLLSDEEFLGMTNEQLLQFMVDCLRGLQQEIATLTTVEFELQHKNAQVDHSFRIVDRDNDDLRQTNVALNEELEEFKNSDATKAAQLQDFAKVTEDLKNEVSALSARISEMMKDHDELVSCLVEELDREHELHEQLGDDKDDELDALKEQLELAREALEEFEATEAQAEQALLNAGLKTEDLHKDITELARQRDAERRQREQGEQDYDKLQTDFDDLKRQSDNEKNELRMVIANRQQDREKAEKTVQDYEKKIAELEQNHQGAMDHEISLRQTTVAKMDKIIAEERKAGEELGNQADALKRENEQLGVQLQTASMRIGELDSDNNTLRLKLDDHEATIQARNTTIEEHENTIGQHAATIIAHETTIQGLRNTIRQNEATIGDRDRNIRDQDSTIQEYTEKINQLTTEKSLVKQKNVDLQDLLALAMKQQSESTKQASQHEEHLSQAISERGFSFVDGEGLKAEGEDAAIGTVHTVGVKTRSSLINKHQQKVRNSKPRDSGLGGMDSSPARQPMFEEGDN